MELQNALAVEICGICRGSVSTRRHFLNSHDREDVAQNATLDILRNWRACQFQGITNPTSYIIQAAFNACKNYLRNHLRRFPRTGIDTPTGKDTWLEHVVDTHQPSVHNTIFTAEETQILGELFEQVERDRPHAFKHVAMHYDALLESYYFCNPRKSLQQFSQEHDVPVGTIKRRLHTAKHLLKDALAAYIEASPPPRHRLEDLLHKVECFDKVVLHAESMTP